MVLGLDTERLSFQERKEYNKQQSIIEKNMEKMSKEKKNINTPERPIQNCRAMDFVI